MRFFDKKYLTRFSGGFNFVTAEVEKPERFATEFIEHANR